MLRKCGFHRFNVGSTDEANNTVKDEQKAFKVGFVCPEATNEGWQVTAAAIEDTAKELNIEISKLYLDPSDYEGSFALAVDTFIQQKVDAIIYGGADESYAATVHKAQEEGIKCVEIDNPTNAGNLWNITVDSYAAAAVAGEWMAKELDAGVVLMINGDMARTNAQQRHDGFVETITNLRSDIEIHEIYANWDSTTALAGVEDAITQYGNRIVGVFSAWDGGALAAVSALEVAGLSDNVIVCGFDGTPTSMTYIREGKLQAEVGQPLYELGKVGMQTVNTVLTGGEAEEKTVVGCSIVTAENVIFLCTGERFYASQDLLGQEEQRSQRLSLARCKRLVARSITLERRSHPKDHLMRFDLAFRLYRRIGKKKAFSSLRPSILI